MTKYYYLKLGTGNCLAEYWLNPKGKRSIYEGYEHAAAIYFGRNTAKDIRECAELYEEEGASKEEALRKFKEKLNSDKDKTSKPDLEAAIHFVRAGEKSEKTCFVTITQKKVCIYEPEKNGVSEMSKDAYDAYDCDLDKLSSKEDKAVTKRIECMKVRSKGKTDPQHIPKIMPVRFLKEPIPIAEVPHVLASLPCNQYLTRGTCREIVPEKNWGAIQAISYCLNGQIDKQPKCAHELMNFLSSYELETLVFLILTNAGLFVPAWRGGTQKGFDLIAYNFTHSAIKKLQLPVESEDRSKSSFTFQVKKGKVKKHSEFADFTVATEYDDDDKKILNAGWLLKNIKNEPKTRKWFRNLLYWIPDIDSKIDEINC